MTRSRFARITAACAVLLATALVAAGCGDDDSDDTKAAGSKTTSTATTAAPETDAMDEDGEATVVEVGVVEGELKFDKTELTAPAGKITLKLDNTDTIQHNIAVEGESSDLVAEGTTEVTVDLEPGEYEFQCDPHASAGMTGTLTVT